MKSLNENEISAVSGGLANLGPNVMIMNDGGEEYYVPLNLSGAWAMAVHEYFDRF
ncbi:hypothetical protein J5837_11160 [Pseudoxanthomonas helianthi]|uniref:Uncharacterized protein n=1 Tax=Pseudoxanthomonas helianthi TaxID=1453541 RepID=A0A940X4E2_9GAMM|nr:hypothetical protein [Pseudoxanthomonas helianthi]MBP3984972.1 hypothetical protein [Pseudoxanthomonas helianthi]